MSNTTIIVHRTTTPRSQTAARRSAGEATSARSTAHDEDSQHLFARLPFALALAPLLLGGCYVVPGSGDIATIDREVERVEHVQVCCGWRVHLEESEQGYVRITGDDNIIDDIDIVEKGDRLELEWKHNHHYEPTRRIDIAIGVTDLESFSGSGGVEVTTGTLSSESLEIGLSGGSDASFGAVDLHQLEVNTSGGSELDISGASEHLIGNLSGGSSLFASNLEAQTVNLDLSGGSFATLTVSDELIVDASGGSEVVFDGSPELDTDLSGGSSVERR